jgi:predicted permease
MQLTYSKQMRMRIRYAITIPQVALSLALVLVSATYVRGLLRVELADLGYTRANLILANPVLKVAAGERAPLNSNSQAEARYAERSRLFYRQVLDRVRAIPGASAAAISDTLPLREPPERPEWFVGSPDGASTETGAGIAAERASISPGYFQTMGMTLLSGRDFDEGDTTGALKVAIVSRAVAERLWPGRDALGRTIVLRNAWSGKTEMEPHTVAGVVTDVRPVLHEGVRRPFIYLSLGQAWRPTSDNLLVRGIHDTGTLVPAIRAAVNAADSNADVPRTRFFAHVVDEMLFPRRVAAGLLTACGAVALLLALVGVYGVVSFSVARRSSEIGIRMALGADRRLIERLLLREGVVVACVGVVAGLILSHAATRTAASAYLAVSHLDLITTVVTSIMLLSVVVLASYLPTRRAASMDPMNVLRNH